MSKEKLTAIANDTVNILKRGHYTSPLGRHVNIKADLERSVFDSRLYAPGSSVSFSEDRPTREVDIEVTKESSLEACSRLREEEPCCLNFASAKNPGGGWLRGCPTQEESLARSSGLFSSLLHNVTYYERNRAQDSMLYTDHAIWSPKVPVIRTDEGTLLEEPYLTSFITIPAPNAGQHRAHHGDPTLVPPCLQRRIEIIFSIAQEYRIQTLVLGAWGCGVFENDPEVVASLFRKALKRWDFQNVVFAIYRGGPAFDTFKRTLHGQD